MYILRKNTAVLKQLLMRGANINFINPSNGWTPLHWAVKQGHVAMVRWFVGAGANINAEDITVPMAAPFTPRLGKVVQPQREVKKVNPGALSSKNKAMPAEPYINAAFKYIFKRLLKRVTTK